MKLTNTIAEEFNSTILKYKNKFIIEKNKNSESRIKIESKKGKKIKIEQVSIDDKIQKAVFLLKKFSAEFKRLKCKLEKKSIFYFLKEIKENYTTKKFDSNFLNLKICYNEIKEKYFPSFCQNDTNQGWHKIQDDNLAPDTTLFPYDFQCKKRIVRTLLDIQEELKYSEALILCDPQNNPKYKMEYEQLYYESMRYTLFDSAESFARMKHKSVKNLGIFLQKCFKTEENKSHKDLITEQIEILYEKNSEIMKREEILKNKVIDFNDKSENITETEIGDQNSYDKEMTSFFEEYKDFIKEKYEIMSMKDELYNFDFCYEFLFKIFNHDMLKFIMEEFPTKDKKDEKYKFAEKVINVFTERLYNML